MHFLCEPAHCFFQVEKYFVSGFPIIFYSTDFYSNLLKMFSVRYNVPNTIVLTTLMGVFIYNSPV